MRLIRKQIIIRQRYLFLILAFSSAVISALVSGIDTIVGVKIEDPFALSLSCFLMAFLVSTLCASIFSIKVKGKSLGSRIIDPSFNHIRFITKKELKYHLLAGFGNAIMTLGYFSLFPILNYDPSVVLPFSQVSILYLVIVESVTEKDTPTLIEIQSAIIVTFGAILGSISLRGSITTEAFAIVFLIINPGWMLFSFYQRKLKLMKIEDKQNDAINIRVWNVVFSLTFTSIILYLYDAINKSHHIYNGLIFSIEQFGWMALMAFGTFFSLVLYIRALGIGKASVAQAVKASVIVFSIPVTILLSYYGYAEISTDPVLILIRAMGIILMMLGIATFTLTLTKAYVFIKMKPGYPIEETMKKLWNIKGINRVAAVAGEYDFIVKVHTRTLVKGYERILEKIQNVPGIKEYRWQSVLKEWEEV